jgi:hypothetical protein
MPISTNSKKYLTQAERSQFVLSPRLKEIMTGLLLGDLCIRRPKTAVNVISQFCQGIIHQDYLLHLYDLFEIYCNTGPKTTNRSPDIRTGKTYNTIGFQTLALPCFKELYDLFYSTGKKIVPLNIAVLLTAVSLAYWLCDDGSFNKRHGCIILNTQGFTRAEVELLTKTLNNKWDLECTINKNLNGFVIRIPAKSLPTLQALLKDIMPSMMLHKIGL